MGLYFPPNMFLNKNHQSKELVIFTATESMNRRVKPPQPQLSSYPFSSFFSGIDYTIFSYKQPHFRVEPRVAIKIPKMRLKVAMKLLSIFGIEAQGC